MREEKDRLAKAREKNIPWKKNARNSEWFHMLKEDTISMPNILGKLEGESKK